MKKLKILISSLILCSMLMMSVEAAFWKKGEAVGNEIKREEFPESKDVEPLTNIELSGASNVLSVKNTKRPISNVNMYISEGSEVYIDENASIGQGNFYLVANGNYKNKHKVVIGKNFRTVKDTIIRTSDGHSLLDPETNIALNEPQDVIIGDNVWIMSRCMVAKGAKIPNNSAVAAYSFVNKQFEEENILLAGIPAKILRHNIKWDIRSYGKYMRDLEKEKQEV